MIDRALFWTGIAACAPQGLRVRRSAPRFPGAAGPQLGAFGVDAGHGPPLRLLGVGDSIVAGVGAETTERAMPAAAARAIAERTGRHVSWRLLGEIGARAPAVVANLRALADEAPYDVIVVSVGVNDVTGLRRTPAWRASVTTLVGALRDHSPCATVVLCGLPPLHRFPLLPSPLRDVLGVRARRFDRELAEIAASLDGCAHLPTEFDARPEAFAADGYHPNAESHEVWGRGVADHVVGRL